MPQGERHELSELLDTATHRVSHLEAAHVQNGSKEASLKDKVGKVLVLNLQQTMHALALIRTNVLCTLSDSSVAWQLPAVLM